MKKIGGDIRVRFQAGDEGFVRMCYTASMDNLTEALARLKKLSDSCDILMLWRQG